MGIERKPFLTGSRVYGIPSAESDLDMVILCDESLIQEIAVVSNQGESRLLAENDCAYGVFSGCYYFGKLNLICVTQPWVFDAWSDGTEKLKSMAPVTREEAVKVLKKFREDAAAKC